MFWPFNRKKVKLPQDLMPPDGIHISITEACFLDCLHCDLGPRKPNPAEPGTNEWKAALDKLYAWLGPCRVDFAGGEPLARKDMIELIAHASGYGMFPVITSNGQLIDERTAAALISAGLRSINISLEAVTPAVHDRIRNRQGAHAKAAAAIQSLNQRRDPARLNITVATVIMGPNLDELLKLVDYTASFGGLLNFQCLYQNFGAEFDPQWHLKSELWPHDYEHVAEVLDALIERKRAGAPINNSELHFKLMKDYFRDPQRKATYECRVGERMLAVNALGEVSLCFFCGPVGNIVREDPREIWNSERAREMRAAMRRCTRNCDLLNCNYQRDGKE